MGNYVLDPELLEMLMNSQRLAPFVLSTDSLERSVFDQGVRRVYEGKHPTSVVLHSQSKAYNTETKPGADNEKMLRSERPGQAVVEKTKPQIEIVRFFVVTEWFGALQNVFQKNGVQAEIVQFVTPSK
jgi:hypothetical protein